MRNYGIRLPSSTLLIGDDVAEEVIGFLKDRGAVVEVLSYEIMLNEKEARRLRLKP